MPRESTEKDLIQYVKVGAIWRRKKTGALVRITKAEDVTPAWNPHSHYDISWETVEKPIRRGVSYQDYWFKNCEPVIPPVKEGDQ